MADIIADPEATLEKFDLSGSILTESPAQQRAEAYADAVEHDSTEVEPLSDEEARELAEEVVQIDVALERLTARREAIKNIYRRLDYGTTTVHAEAKVRVTVGHNPVFNELQFLEKFPYDFSRVDKVVEKGRFGDKIVDKVVYPNRVYYKTTPDRAAIKKLLSKEEYDSLFDEGVKKITIK